jgi:hypothetical protein
MMAPCAELLGDALIPGLYGRPHAGTLIGFAGTPIRA